MSTPSAPPSSTPHRGADPPTDRQHAAVFWEWCLRREAFRIAPQLALTLPLVMLAMHHWWFWPHRWHPNRGADSFKLLVEIASTVIIGGGAIHASQAFCWEVSPELRELVRLTGIGPITLLCCKTLARWSTIGCSVLLLTPAVFFAITLGGVTTAHLGACAAVLLMLAALTAGMALVAGVSATESQNASTTAVMATFLLLLLYHVMFWLTAGVINLGYIEATGEWGPIPFNSWWRIPYDFAWQSAPLTVMVRACNSPDLFSPLSPSYWIHFLTALFGFRMASVVMINRFRSLRAPAEADLESTGSTTKSRGGGRPRCTEAPHFWKDSQILAGGFRSQLFWGLTYVLMAFGVLLAGVSRQQEVELSLTLAIIAECAWPVIFAVRLDGLISAEFRQQTWQSLMLLPIDRRTLLWSKVRAVAWQQRAALLPVGLAVAFGLPRAPIPVVMTGVIATLAGMLMCQVSAVYYLTPRYWWAGPVQAGAILTLIGICLMFWLVAFDPWVSFFMTVTLMLVILVAFQSFLEARLESWTE